eukprot:m.216756 g.216756  ORF g.216756 m.216756 type:complete len:51 (+) comp33216_c0_seq4:691-843(+)
MPVHTTPLHALATLANRSIVVEKDSTSTSTPTSTEPAPCDSTLLYGLFRL